MRKRLVSAARCAIRMRSKEPDRKKAVKLLERDLINGPNHCFGIHDGCSPDFCSTVRQRAPTSSGPGDMVEHEGVSGGSSSVGEVTIDGGEVAVAVAVDDNEAAVGIAVDDSEAAVGVDGGEAAVGVDGAVTVSEVEIESDEVDVEGAEHDIDDLIGMSLKYPVMILLN